MPVKLVHIHDAKAFWCFRGIQYCPKLDQKIDRRSSFHWLCRPRFHRLGQLEFGHPVTEMPATPWDEEKYWVFYHYVSLKCLIYQNQTNIQVCLLRLAWLHLYFIFLGIQKRRIIEKETLNEKLCDCVLIFMINRLQRYNQAYCNGVSQF
jgi:hypothetical protein